MKLITIQKEDNYIEEGEIIWTPFPYDPNGNLISGFDKNYTYDGFNQLTKITNSTNGRLIEQYAYDAEGNRVKKADYDYSTGINATTYYISDNFIQIRYSNGTILNETYYYANDKLVAKKDNSGSKNYYHGDHLGSTTLVTNQSGNIVEENFYEPFGKIFSGLGLNRFLFAGKERDKLVDLDYLGARYYNPFASLFIQCDTIKPDIYNPQALNCYSYVLNNPYKYTDETGNIPVLVVAVPAIVIGGIQGYITYQQTGDIGKAVLSGTIAGGATAASILISPGTTVAAIASGGLRSIATAGVGTAIRTTALAGIGAGQEFAQETLVEGRGYNEISGRDILTSAVFNSVISSRISQSSLPGIIRRTPGQFYPSSQLGKATFSEAISQTAQSGYSEFGESIFKGTVDSSNKQTNSNSQSNRGGRNLNNAISSKSNKEQSRSNNNRGGCGVIMSCI